MSLTIFIGTSLISFLLTYIYKYLWKLSPFKDKTATGYGLLLIPFLYIYSLYFNELNGDKIIFFVILVFSIIYWLDDTLHLSSIFRFLLQFCCGVILAIILLIFNQYELNFYFVFIVILSGLINIFFSNSVNFYDGLDLNISTLAIILGLTIIFKLDLDIVEKHYGIIIIGFVLGFSVFNIKPNNIFFGDSGCFVIACFVNFLLIKSILTLNLSIILLLIPFLLPIVDVLYVLALRVYKNEKLLSRNYHHLYHQIQLKYKNKVYLIPQIFNALVILVISKIIIEPNGINMHSIKIFVIVSILFTIITYIISKKIIETKT